MVLVVQVAALLDAAEAPDEARIQLLLDAWLTECDRLAPVDEESKYNEMHVSGLGVCALLHRCELAGYADFGLAAALGPHAARVVLHAEAPSAMSWLAGVCAVGVHGSKLDLESQTLVLPHPLSFSLTHSYMHAHSRMRAFADT